MKQLIERKRIDNEYEFEVLRDLTFSHGFSVSKFHSNSSNGEPIGYFDYDGNRLSGPYEWSLSQWGCKINFLDSIFAEKDGVITYDDTSKYSIINTNKPGTISLGIKGSLEFGKDDSGAYVERKNIIDNWPHILLGQEYPEKPLLKGAQNLIFEITYLINKFDRLTLEPADPNLNTCQFQWFITIQDVNKLHKSYMQTIFFGFSMFDARYINDTPKEFIAIDGGKEDSTGLLIYMFGLEDALKNEYNSVVIPSSVVNKKCDLKVDALPYIMKALDSAKEYGIFLDSTIDDLAITSTNIGFEIPGNYDCGVEISNMNLKIKK